MIKALASVAAKAMHLLPAASASSARQSWTAAGPARLMARSLSAQSKCQTHIDILALRPARVLLLSMLPGPLPATALHCAAPSMGRPGREGCWWPL